MIIWLCISWMVAPGDGVLAQAEALRQDDPQAAIALLEPALTDPALQGEAAIMLSRIHRQLDNKDEAEAMAEKAVAWLPESSDAHIVLAQAMSRKFADSRLYAMRKIGAYKAAIERSLELDPTNTSALGEKIGFNISAPAIVGASKDTARELIEKLKGLDEVYGLQMQAMLQGEEKNTDGLIATYRRLTELEPGKPVHRFNWGYQLVLQERFQAALDIFKPLLSDGVAYPPALYQAGRAHIVGKMDLAAAEPLLLAYIDHREADAQPTAADAWWRIGVARDMQGKQAAAREAYEKALSMDADHEQAKAALRNLN